VSMADYHAKLRREIGEDAYLARMARVRSHRKDFGKPFRLDYVDKQGRTGSQLAAEAGRRGGKASVYKRKQENNKSNAQNQNQQSASN
jgi:hypothetical protein